MGRRGGCHASVFHGRDDRAPLLRAAARFVNPGGSSSRMTHFSAAKRRFCGGRRGALGDGNEKAWVRSGSVLSHAGR